MEEARYARYKGMVDPSTLQALSVSIIGVGAVGHKVALLLAEMGVGAIRVIDPDTVEEKNLGVQGYRPDQVGMKKATATLHDVKALSPGIDANRHVTRALTLPACDVAFVCVDSMEARNRLYNHDTNVGWIVDTRVGGELGRVIAGDFHALRATLYDDKDALDLPCDARMVAYNASLVASVAVYAAKRWMQGQDECLDMSLSLEEMAFQGMSLSRY